MSRSRHSLVSYYASLKMCLLKVSLTWGHNPKAILANSNNPYLVIKAVLEQSSGLIFTCQYAQLASNLEYHTFPAKVSRHSSTRGNGNTSPIKENAECGGDPAISV
jgi:hypothetical protein